MPPSAPPDPAAPPAPSAGGAPWYARAFGRLYLTVYGHRDEAEAAAHAPAILARLGVPWNARILDVGCGEGRYARALQAMGCRVTGVDLSAALLEEARRRSPDLPGTPTFVRGDMRELPFVQQFEAAISMFTSIGYFDRAPRDDVRVFEGVRRALVPGGRFLVDFLNAEEVRASLVPASTEIRAPYRVEIRRRIEDEGPGGVVVKDVRVVDSRTDSVEGEFQERVRLYGPDDLDELLSTAGLVPVGDRFGHVDGRPYAPDAPRLVRVAERRGGRRVGTPVSADDPGLYAGPAPRPPR